MAQKWSFFFFFWEISHQRIHPEQIYGHQIKADMRTAELNPERSQEIWGLDQQTPQAQQSINQA